MQKYNFFLKYQNFLFIFLQFKNLELGEGQELDKQIIKTFNFLWEYDRNLSRWKLLHYTAKYFKTTYKRVVSLVGEE